MINKESLLNTLKEDLNWEKRRDAAEDLCKFTDKEVVDALVHSLLEDEQWVVRFMSADSLGEIGSTNAVEPLIEALDDPESTVVRYAAEALGKIGDERAIEPLLDALASYGRDFSPCQAAAEGLAKFGVRVLDPVLECLDDDNRRSAALIALRGIGDPRSIQPLADLLEDGSLPVHIQVRAAKALAATKDPEAANYLKEALSKAADLKLVHAITAGLEELDLEGDSLDALKKAAEERAAVQLLNNLKGVKIGMDEEELINLIGSPAFSMNAAAALGKLAPDYLKKQEIWEYKNKYGGFSIVVENGVVIKKRSVNRIINEIEKELPEKVLRKYEKKWWQFWK